MKLPINVLAAAAVLIPAAALAAADNFIRSCNADSVKIVGGRTRQASCRTRAGTSSYKCSRLDLNSCLKNAYGRLQPCRRIRLGQGT